jgi:hypothetical protein
MRLRSSLPIAVLALILVALLGATVGATGCSKKEGADKDSKTGNTGERATPASNTTTLGGATNPEAKAVRASFANYKKAILSKDGKTAAGLIDSETLAFYGKLLALAISAPAAEVHKQSAGSRLFILQTRHHVSLSVMKGMDGRTLVAWGINKGWIGANAKRIDIGDITVAGDHAAGPGKVRDRTVPFNWSLRKEGGVWKLNLLALFPMAEAAMEKVAKRGGMSVDDLIMQAIKTTSKDGKKVTPALWEPPKK